MPTITMFVCRLVAIALLATTPLTVKAQSLFDMPIELPTGKPRSPSATIILALGNDGQFWTCGRALETLDGLEALLEKGRDTTIFLHADRSIDFSLVVSAMDDLRRLGFVRVGLVADDAAIATKISPADRQIKACRES